MTLNERISTYCKNKKIKQLDLVKIGCGSKQTVNAIINNKNKPSSQFLEAFLKAFSDIDARWLLTGSEEYFVHESRAQYGFCKECVKKEGIIEFLKKECVAKDKRIEELKRLLPGGQESQATPEVKAS
jgi:transcriptional regulator with XRE-family HTH domain